MFFKKKYISLTHGLLKLDGITDAEVIDESQDKIGDVTLRVYGEEHKVLVDFHYIWATTANQDLEIILKKIKKQK